MAGDPRDEIEIRVVVKHHEAGLFRGRRDQEIGDLAALQPARRKQPLDLARPADMCGIRLDQRKRRECRGQSRTLAKVAGREPMSTRYLAMANEVYQHAPLQRVARVPCAHAHHSTA